MDWVHRGTLSRLRRRSDPYYLHSVLADLEHSVGSYGDLSFRSPFPHLAPVQCLFTVSTCHPHHEAAQCTAKFPVLTETESSISFRFKFILKIQEVPRAIFRFWKVRLRIVACSIVFQDVLRYNLVHVSIVLDSSLTIQRRDVGR